MKIVAKIKRLLIRLRLKPIRVINFHEIDDFCAGSSDWVPSEYLQSYLLRMLSEGYTFISLSDAQRHLREDWFRTRKYAVVTADDGLKCQSAMLPWLAEHGISITLFLNVTSVNQTECGLPYKKWFHLDTPALDKQKAKEIYFSEMDIKHMDPRYVTIALHGYAHNESVTDMTSEQFIKDVERSQVAFGQWPGYVPYYAYPYGQRNATTDAVLAQKQITPVLMDGKMNYNDPTKIHRESIEKIYRDAQH